MPRLRCRRVVKHGIGSLKIQDIVNLWLLRLLVPLGGHREFIKNSRFKDEVLAQKIGVGELPEAEWREFDPKEAYAQLRKKHREAEELFSCTGLFGILPKNIAKISDLAGLSDTDRVILAFVVFLHSESLLDETADMLGKISSSKVYQVLAILLGLPEQDIRTSLAANGLLAKTGLVTLTHESRSLSEKLDVLSSSFAASILHSDADPVTLLRDIVVPGKPATLCFEDFEHIRPALTVIFPYLHHALAVHRQGVNILLHGVPGTGKSEFSRLLAMELECELFEVASEDDEGNPVESHSRFQAFRAAQSFFIQRRALILFDEIEDVFRDSYSFAHPLRRNSHPQSRKAWVNRMLEGNPVPTIWVSNALDCIDQAYVRRFDVVIEMPVPPQRQRERIIRSVCGDMLPEETIRRIAAHDAIAPAVVSRAVSVVRCVRSDLGEQDIPGTVERLISSTLEAQRHRPFKRNDPNRLPETYDPAFLNVEEDLLTVAEGLARTRSGRLCLYGPPGTGKTAFVRWLSERLELQLSVQRASDLISMWVGGTEANIAKAFQDAEQDKALLLIDEVDSFLQDRRRAQHSWEVTAVNEMLTQMENFPGVFIASTNLMDGLDQAALRRFDLKLQFGYLQSGQAWELFVRQCAALLIPVPSRELKSALDRLAILTPGDFAAVARQHRFRPIATPIALLSALEQECLVKEGGQRKLIGF